MKKIGYLFPGQGSQCIGMGQDAAAMNADAAALFSTANDTLGFDITGLCKQGPEDELKQTQNTQPALYTASAATLEVLSEAGIKPTAVAGHSLGEYTALYAAGVFDFETGLRLVRARGEAFAEAGSLRPGAMAAIIGLGSEVVEENCRKLSQDNLVVVAANINEPAQIVISGDPKAVKEACEVLTQLGARRALPLPVSGAFHSPLVEPAADRMKALIEPVDFSKPSFTFINNVDGAELSDPDEIKDSLVRQITGSVRWVDCVTKLISEGVEAFVEVGSGKALAGLCRRIDKTVPCYTTESEASIRKTIEALTS